MKNKKAGIIILDGWGIGPKYNGNAFLNAKTPVINELLEKCSKTEIETSGEFVGLPKGQMGNSEVGHMNIGTGREILQSFTRISKVIKEKKLIEGKCGGEKKSSKCGSSKYGSSDKCGGEKKDKPVKSSCGTGKCGS